MIQKTRAPSRTMKRRLTVTDPNLFQEADPNGTQIFIGIILFIV